MRQLGQWRLSLTQNLPCLKHRHRQCCVQSFVHNTVTHRFPVAYVSVWIQQTQREREMHMHTVLLSCVLFFFFLNQGIEREFHQSHRNRSGFQPAEGGVSPVLGSSDTRPSCPPGPDVSGWGGGNGLDIWSESTWREADSGWWRLLLGDLKKKKKNSGRVQIVRFRSCDSGVMYYCIIPLGLEGNASVSRVCADHWTLQNTLSFIVCKTC